MYIFVMSHLLYQAPRSRADQKRETQTERHDKIKAQTALQ